MMRKNIVRLMIGALSLLAVSCSPSKSDPDAATSGITISGSLNLNSSSSYSTLSKLPGETIQKQDIQSLSTADYKVQCSSIDDSSSKVTAQVNSDGTFSVPGVAKNSVGCNCKKMQASERFLLIRKVKQQT